MGIDWDDKFAYTTAKLVRIRHRAIGGLYKATQILIVIYVGFYQCFWQKGYLQKEIPFGNVDAIVYAPTEFGELGNLSYCGSKGGEVFQLPCISWSASDTTIVQDQSVVIGTRLKITTQEKAACDEYQYGCENWKTSGEKEVFVGDVENYRLKLSHQVSSESYQGFTTGTAKIHNPPRMQAYADGKSVEDTGRHHDDADWFTVAQLIRLLPGRFDGATSAHNLRYEGISALVYVDYTNNPTPGSTDISYTYRLVATQGEGVHRTVVTVDSTTRKVVEIYGLRIGFQCAGHIGVYSLKALMLSFVTGMALMSSAKTIGDMMLTYVLKHKAEYALWKYDVTPDFDPDSAREKRVLAAMILKKKNERKYLGLYDEVAELDALEKEEAKEQGGDAKKKKKKKKKA